MIHNSPVRPQPPAPTDSGGRAAASRGRSQATAEGREEGEFRDILQGDKDNMDGKDLILHDGENAAALPPRHLIPATTMTPAQK